MLLEASKTNRILVGPLDSSSELSEDRSASFEVFCDQTKEELKVKIIKTAKAPIEVLLILDMVFRFFKGTEDRS